MPTCTLQLKFIVQKVVPTRHIVREWSSGRSVPCRYGIFIRWCCTGGSQCIFRTSCKGAVVVWIEVIIVTRADIVFQLTFLPSIVCSSSSLQVRVRSTLSNLAFWLHLRKSTFWFSDGCFEWYYGVQDFVCLTRRSPEIVFA